MRFTKVALVTTFLTDGTGRISIELQFEDATYDEFRSIQEGLNLFKSADQDDIPPIVYERPRGE